MVDKMINIFKADGFEVRYMESDGMFNATELLKQYNNTKGLQKSLDHFFANYKTVELLSNINEGSYIKTRISRGVNKGTWMRGDLFLHFCLWLSPKYEYKFIKMLYESNCGIIDTIINNDEKINYNTYTYVFKVNSFKNVYKIGKTGNIKFREKDLSKIYGEIELIFLIESNIEKELHEKYFESQFIYSNCIELFTLSENDLIDLGILYQKSLFIDEFYNAIRKFDDIIHSKVNEGLNLVVFGHNEIGVRQVATKNKINELYDLQKQLAFVIDNGFVKTFDELINILNRLYSEKNIILTK